MMKPIDIFGIGHPLMDLLTKGDDKLIQRLGLKKGTMTLVDNNTSKNIFQNLNQQTLKVSYGDSTANTLCGAAGLGLKTIYLGKTGDDDYADQYEQDLSKRKVITRMSRNKSVPTGTVLGIITPDAERTFAVNLGAAITLDSKDLLEKDVRNAKILHITGYQLENLNNRKIIFEAAELAKKFSTLVSVDVADPGVVSRNKSLFHKFITTYADILFLNEEEAKAFTGKEEEKDIVTALDSFADVVCLKLGARGSVIMKEGILYSIAAEKVKAVDTTGAGDMYAACILYGIIKGIDLEKSGMLASKLSGEVVSKMGARLDTYPSTVTLFS